MRPEGKIAGIIFIMFIVLVLVYIDYFDVKIYYYSDYDMWCIYVITGSIRFGIRFYVVVDIDLFKFLIRFN